MNNVTTNKQNQEYNTTFVLVPKLHVNIKEHGLATCSHAHTKSL